MNRHCQFQPQESAKVSLNDNRKAAAVSTTGPEILLAIGLFGIALTSMGLVAVLHATSLF